LIVATRHFGQTRRAFKADRKMANFGEGFEIAPRPAAKIKDRIGRLAFDIFQN
jgi:hypothetical protein